MHLRTGKPPWPYMPSVPAAGHVTARGFWHPGRPENCRKCPPPTQRRSLMTERPGTTLVVTRFQDTVDYSPP